MAATKTEPFAPPAEDDPAAGNLTGVIAAWAMSAACLGTFVGGLMRLTGAIESTVTVGLGAAGAGAFVGVLGWMVDRRLAANRPAVVDGRGRLTKPASIWLMALPLLIAAVGMAGLVVVAAVQAGSLTYGLGFLAVVFGLFWFTRPLWTSHRLTQAVALAESGEPDAARNLFLKIADGWWITGSGKAQAQLNLGLLSLRDGDLFMAARWYELPQRGKAGAFAASGLALVRVLQERFGEAEAHLHTAVKLGRSSVQPEVDGVRLLLVLRRDGAMAAREMGERLLDYGSGGVFCAALAIARVQTGQPDAARDLLDGGIGESLRQAGMAELLPELAEIV